MPNKRTMIGTLVLGGCIPAMLALLAGCSRKPDQATVTKLAPGAKFAGFLSDYAKLQPNPNFENTLSYVRQDDLKNVHKYIAVIVEPVEIYVATNADPSKMPDRGRTALAAYFQSAITRAVSDAYPVVQEPGPLVLRLRTALIGVDVGGAIAANPNGPEKLERAIDIGKVGVEMEMVDSVTGEQIAAAVDRQNLGSGATIESANFSREENFAAAREAFDGWAARLRDFLDSAEELSQKDQERADSDYQPFGGPPSTN
jgi:Protein of unknown function (DUF3313)